MTSGAGLLFQEELQRGTGSAEGALGGRTVLVLRLTKSGTARAPRALDASNKMLEPEVGGARPFELLRRKRSFIVARVQWPGCINFLKHKDPQLRV